MTLVIILFFIAIIVASLMLIIKTQKIKSGKDVSSPDKDCCVIPEIPFRQVEKIMLYLAKHIIQWFILMSVKYWLITTNKIKEIVREYLPKIENYFEKNINPNTPRKSSFIHRAIIESKIKIYKMKQRMKEDRKNKLD